MADAPRFADSITFTVAQLDDVIACVSRALDEGTGYGHYLPDDPEYTRAEDARTETLQMLQRFQRAAKKRASKPARTRYRSTARGTEKL